MIEVAKVADHPNLVRDMRTGVIINTDNEGFKAYIASRQRRESLEQRVDAMEKNVELILKLLQERK